MQCLKLLRSEEKNQVQKEDHNYRMASPAKQPKVEPESATGYLHCVSPIKISKKNTKYFEAMLQTGREDYHRLVAFPTGKRPAFVQSSNSKQAVKLTNIRRDVSYTDPDGSDVIFGAASGMVVGTAPFFWRQPPGTTRLQMKDVLMLGPRQKVGEVHVRFLPDGVVSRMVSVDGAMRELKEFRVCDPTGHTTLTLWERTILSVEPSKSYKVCHLATRKFADRTTLTSTQQTTATVIEDVGLPECLPQEVSDTSSLRGCVTAVSIQEKHRCRRCHHSQRDFPRRCSTHRCEGCRMLQKSSAFTVTYSGSLELECDGEDNSVTLTNSVVWGYVREHLGGYASDAEVVEEHLLGAGDLKITLSSDGMLLSIEVLSIEVPVVSATSGGQSGEAESAADDSQC